jgi:CubicO group peptidase (beta-lactamase class C family)
METGNPRKLEKSMRVRIRIALVVGVLLCIAAVAGTIAVAEHAGKEPQQSEISSDTAQLIQRIEGPQVPNRQGLDGLTLQEVMAKLHTPGVSVAVIKDFKVQWAKGYGVADVKTGRAVAVNTLFQAASISKPVTAMAAMKFGQDGRFSLDDDVNKLLKSWHVPESEFTRQQTVTPRSLFSHTSGADDGFGFPGYAPGAPLPTLVQILNGEKPSNVGPVKFVRAPYQGYKYSGGGIVIMQVALTDLLGEPFAEMMQSTILGPLGMSNSTYQQPLPDAMQAHAAHAYDDEGRAMDAPWHVYPEQAAAGLWTTPTDLAKVAIEMQRALQGPSGMVLKEATAREMIAPTGAGPFGVGFQIEQKGQGWYFSHSGGNWGFQCRLLAHVRKGYGVVVMTNSGNGSKVVDEIEARVAAAYGWDSLDKPIFR